MWPRKKLDIGWADLAFGVFQVAAAQARPSEPAVVGAGWIPPGEALVSLSVRSGWDLLLSALRLPRGSEIVVSAVTIHDMVRVIEHHGLVPVPVDVTAERLEPIADNLERAITPRTRAILVAHLFGTRVDMAPIIELARQNDLLVFEDCAQAFVGHDYAGHHESDGALFSFGPIKTATALGGAVVRVRDPALRCAMAELQRAYPLQSRWSYCSRLGKYAAFRFLCLPIPYGLLVRCCRALGIDYDHAFSNAAHSFGSADFFAQIRRQPCVPLTRMLQRRIATFEARGRRVLRRRTWRGDQLARAMAAGMVVGDRNRTHSYWVVPMRVANPAEVLSALRSAGFDATARSSLVVVPTPNGPPEDETPLAPWLAETLYLPGCENMPDREWQRLVSILDEVALPVEVRPTGEPAALPGVPVAS